MSIFDTIGGASAVSVAVDKFYGRVLSDPQLAHYVDKADMDKLKSHQCAFIATAMGGPTLYRGRDMATAHAKLSITDLDFDAVVGHLVATLTELEVPNKIIAGSGPRLLPCEQTSSACPHPRPAANQVPPRYRRDR